METQPPRLTKAFKKASVLNITQGFSAKHPAIDIVSIYGTPLVAPENIKVIGLWGNEALSLSTEGLQRGYGIKMQGVESGLIHVYWHCQPIFPVRLDDLVLRGQIVAYMGKSGQVYQQGKLVPLSENSTAPNKGTHLHQIVYLPSYKAINPIINIDWYTEPTYTIPEWIASWLTTLAKMGKILSR